LGALLTIWVLARTLGFAGAIRIGAFLNLACAAAALLVVAARDAAPGGSEEAQATDAAPLPESAVEAPCASASGPGSPCTLFRGSSPSPWRSCGSGSGTIHKPSSFTFSTLLAIYLLGLGEARSSAGAGPGARAGPWPRSSRCKLGSVSTPASPSAS